MYGMVSFLSCCPGFYAKIVTLTLLSVAMLDWKNVLSLGPKRVISFL